MTYQLKHCVSVLLEFEATENSDIPEIAEDSYYSQEQSVCQNLF